MKAQLLCFLLIFIFFKAASQSPAQVIPDFKFYKAHGTVFNKSQINPGKKSVIVFFDATCSHCQKTMLELSKKYAELEKLNIYLVSLDQHITMNYFMSQYGKNLVGRKNVLMLEDRDHVFIPLFKPVKYPSLFVYSPQNKLTFYTSGDEKLAQFFAALKK